MVKFGIIIKLEDVNKWINGDFWDRYLQAPKSTQLFTPGDKDKASSLWYPSVF